VTELRTVLRALDPSEWTDEKVTTLFSAMDVHQRSRISAEEFLEWVFSEEGSGHGAFSAALELAKTPAAALKIAHAAEATTLAGRKISLRRDLQRLEGSNIVNEVKAMPPKDFKASTSAGWFPDSVRRTYEAAHLLLNAQALPSPPKVPRVKEVTKTLSDGGALPRMADFDARQKALRQAPDVVTFVVDEYFKAKEDENAEVPLRYSDVLTAHRTMIGSKAEGGPAVLVLRWCQEMLLPELTTLALEEERKEAEEEARQREEEEAAKKEAEDRVRAEEEAASRAQEEARRAKEEEDARRAAEAEAARLKAEEEAREAAARKAAARAAAEAEARAKAEREAAERARAEAEAMEKLKLPDRYFEAHVPFESGCVDITADQEVPVQNVAATVCMRQQLCVQLFSCSDEDEAPQRLTNVERFLRANGATNVASATAAAPSSYGSGVVCRVVLDTDPDLIAHFRGLGSKPGTEDIAEFLNDGFKCIKC